MLQTSHQLLHILMGIKAQARHARIQFDVHREIRNALTLCGANQCVKQVEVIDFGFQTMGKKCGKRIHLGIHHDNVARDSRIAEFNSLIRHRHCQIIHATFLKRLGNFHCPRTVCRSLNHAHHLGLRGKHVAVMR